jgi:hypothetical protein
VEHAASIFMAGSSALKMEAPCSSKTLVTIYQNTKHHNPEESNLISKLMKTNRSEIQRTQEEILFGNIPETETKREG